jgi:hypothetical protein
MLAGAGMICAAFLAGGARAEEPQPLIAAADIASLATNLDLTMYLEPGERVRQAAALDQASRMPIGNGASWADESTRAAGRVVPLRDYVGLSGARCRDYRIIIDVPQRFTMMWTEGDGTYNGRPIQLVPQRVSPAHTREYIAEVCGAASGFASAGRR